MSEIELTQDEAGVLMQQLQGIGERLAKEPLGEITPVLAELTADAMFHRPGGFFRRAKPIPLRVTPAQAETLLRAIEDNDGLQDRSLRGEARAELRRTPWIQVNGLPGLSLLKKLVQVVSS